MVKSENQSSLLVIRLLLLALQKDLLAFLKEQFDRESGRITQPAEWLQIIMVSERYVWMKELTSLIIDIDVLSEFDEIQDAQAAIVKQETQRILIDSDTTSSEFNKHYKQLLMSGAPLLEQHNKLKNALQSLPDQKIPTAEALDLRSKWHEEHRTQSRKRRN